MTQFEPISSDYSLISDISEIDCSSFISNSDDAHIDPGLLESGRSSDYISMSQLRSSCSNNSALKQVRFNSAVAVSAFVSGSTPVETQKEINSISPIEEHDEFDDFTSVTLISNVPTPFFSDDRSCSERSYNMPCKTVSSLSSNQDSADSSSSLARNDSVFMLPPVGPGLSKSSYTGKKPMTLFRTSDHLPRPPVTSRNPCSDTEKEKSKSTMELEAAIPRVPLTQNCVSLNPQLSLSVLSLDSDEHVCGCEHSGNSREISSDGVDHPISMEMNLSRPVPQTVHLLGSEIECLREKLNQEWSMGPSPETQKLATHLVDQACDGSNQNNMSSGSYIPNPGLTVNIPADVCMYTNLMDLSVDESEIVQLERERVAHQRRRLARIRERQAAKYRTNSPEPDLLEFFDPNRHIFQSVNLHIKGLPNFLPSLTRASCDSVDAIFNERTFEECSRSLHFL